VYKRQALGEGLEAAAIAEALKDFSSVPGRFEQIKEGQPFSVIVDYAHTPDGLENVLRTARQIARRRIIVVFGCGGDRDKTKRPIMGKIAAEMADVVIATSDNPRTESPTAILQDIETGIKSVLASNPSKSKTVYQVIEDRRLAIKEAINMAEDGDVVLIAGKGHETYQIIGSKTIPFDDRTVAREFLQRRR